MCNIFIGSSTNSFCFLSISTQCSSIHGIIIVFLGVHYKVLLQTHSSYTVAIVTVPLSRPNIMNTAILFAKKMGTCYRGGLWGEGKLHVIVAVAAKILAALVMVAYAKNYMYMYMHH